MQCNANSYGRPRNVSQCYCVCLFYHHLWSQGRHQEKNIYFGALIKLPPSPLPVFQGCLFPTLFSRMDVDSFEMICFHSSAGCSGSRQLAATDKGVLCSQLRTSYYSPAAAPLHASDNILTPDPGFKIPDSRFKTRGFLCTSFYWKYMQLLTSVNIEIEEKLMTCQCVCILQVAMMTHNLFVVKSPLATISNFSLGLETSL